jgi:cbb3-type cytochrome oxidase subunit 1
MSERFLKLAVVYGLSGMILGTIMGISNDFGSRDVHAHIGLLGWVSMALMGLCYRAFPALARSPLATAHFWFYNAGVPTMLAGLWAIVHERAGLGEPLAGLGATCIMTGMLCFAVNVWRNCGSRETGRETGISPAARTLARAG